jgi:predicted transposase YdaD
VEWLSSYEQHLVEKGEKRGIRVGRAQGRQEGRQEGAAEVLRRQLSQRFGHLSPSVEKRLAKASEEQLAQWSVTLLDAQTLKQVFSARQ